MASSSNAGTDGRPTAFFLGDSHTICVMAAAKQLDLKALPFKVFASRFEKVKRETGAIIAGVTVEAAMTMLDQASPKDILISLIGGNQFNALGLMRNPKPFNFYDPSVDNLDILPSEQLIPFRIIEDMFDRYAGKFRQNFLLDVRERFKGRMVHAAPPPPKFDNKFIRTHAETMFKDRGIDTHGVGRPEVRLKLWRAQIRAMRRLYDPLGIEVLMPPDDCVDVNGYLKKEAYGPDATHANVLYGKSIIMQIEGSFNNAEAHGVIT